MIQGNAIKYQHNEVVHNFKAAEEILPIVMQLFPVRSLLDVGCGIGTWLHVAEKLGIQDVMGIDGDYVESSMLKIAASKFKAHDLETAFSLSRKFDLVLCLEVAEHLNATAAATFVKSLTTHSDIILFSAAIPFQEGQNHVNEQWTSYWVEKFEQQGYLPADILREKIWDNEKIEWWYRQNSLFFINKNYTEANNYMTSKPVNKIHPELYLKKVNKMDSELATHRQNIENGGVFTVKEILKMLMNKLKRKLG